MTLPAISGADHRIADYPGNPCPHRPRRVNQIARVVEAFSFDAPLLAGALGQSIFDCHRLPDNSVGDYAIRNDRLRAERPRDLDERLRPATALNSRDRAIALPRRIG
jgi:hypothetical protein